MTATAHALIGGAIGASVQNPVLGLTLSAVSHPLVDMIPHWDAGWGWREKTKVRLFLEGCFDLGLGCVLAYLLFYNPSVNFIYFALCIFVSVGWDIAETPYWFLRWKFFPFGLIYKIQSKIQGKAAPPWGILTQIATVIIVVLTLQLLPKF